MIKVRLISNFAQSYPEPLATIKDWAMGLTMYYYFVNPFQAYKKNLAPVFFKFPLILVLITWTF
jgi:uncharacterized membrane protein YhdT